MFGKKRKSSKKMQEAAPAVEVKTIEVTEEATVTEQLEEVVKKVDQIIEKLDLSEMTREQLVDYAKEKGIKVNRGMVRAELIKKITKRAE